MAFYRGQDGTLTIGGSAPGEIQEFSFTIDEEIISSTAKGTDWMAKKAGHKSWSGSMSFNLDFSSAPQVALLTAAYSGTVSSNRATLVLFPAGNVASLKKFTGTAILGPLTITSPEGSSKVSFSCTFEGDGELVMSDISA